MMKLQNNCTYFWNMRYTKVLRVRKWCRAFTETVYGRGWSWQRGERNECLAWVCVWSSENSVLGA